MPPFNLSSVSLVSELPCSLSGCSLPLGTRNGFQQQSGGLCSTLDDGKCGARSWLPARRSLETPSHRRQPNSQWQQTSAQEACLAVFPASSFSHPRAGPRVERSPLPALGGREAEAGVQPPVMGTTCELGPRWLQRGQKEKSPSPLGCEAGVRARLQTGREPPGSLWAHGTAPPLADVFRGSSLQWMMLWMACPEPGRAPLTQQVRGLFSVSHKNRRLLSPP